jgi:hypothetical protein
MSSLKVIIAIGAGVLLGSSMMMAQPAAVPATEESITGKVTCEWRATHLYQCRRYQTLQTCTLDCVQQGSKFSLASGNKLYVLEASYDQLAPCAGGEATVTGLVSRGANDDSIKVHAIAPKVKAGDEQAMFKQW